jgi:hypothetical protein
VEDINIIHTITIPPAAIIDDCKGTSVHTLTLSPLLYPINSYSTLCRCTSTPTPVPIPIVDDYLSPIVDDLHICKSSTLASHLHSYLSHIGQASDT